ncbi:MAG: NUDIX domain-containing protein [Methylococcales bacterium]|nr:NUDIX domain-containing protein [Methylococcales bacterium]
MHSQQQVLLEKRPPTGIWGGLWSFPEFSSIQEADDWCKQSNIILKKQTKLSCQRHTFSHYHLDYTPLLIKCDSPNTIVMEKKRSCLDSLRTP